MRKYLLAATFLAILLAVPLVIIAGGSWYSGGSLHKATVGQWKTASYDNKLATAADWAVTHPTVKSKVQKGGSMETLRPFAVQLMLCVDEAAAGKGYDSTSVAQLAASCVILMGW